MLSADLLRRLDRWVGLPMVALLGLLSWPFRRWRKPEASGQGPLLVIQLSEMGSVIVAEPALRELAQRGQRFHFLILERNAACLKLLPSLPLERVFVLRDRSLWTLALDSLRFLLWSRRQRLLTTLDLELFSRFSVLLATLGGASRRIGFAHQGEGLSQGGLLTDPVSYNPRRHMAVNYLALSHCYLGAAAGTPPASLLGGWGAGLEGIGSELLSVTPFPHREGELQQIRDRLQQRLPLLAGRVRRVLVQVGAEEVLPQRNWPRRNWVETIRELLQREPVQVVLCGRTQESAEAERIRRLVGSQHCVNGCGVFSVSELPQLYRCAALLIAADSGPAHFAAVTSLPVLVLFGPETPELFRPLGTARVLYAGLPCSPCVTAANHRVTHCQDNRCMQAISVERVVVEARQLLADQGTVKLVVGQR